VRRAGTTLALAAALSLIAAASADPARAYVRYRSDSGTAYAWPNSCIGVIAYPDDLADMMPADQVLGAASAAAAAWSHAALPETALDIQVVGTTGATPIASLDRQNSLIFRRDGWCNATHEPGTCGYNPAALALTTVFARVSTGEILDADIEVNAALFDWTDVALSTADPAALAGEHDLQNALTHELGHLIGLDHPCAEPDVSPGLDNLGQPAPACAAAPAELMETTMFPSSTPGDIAKRTLAADDQLAAREIYPAAPGQAPAECAAPIPKGTDPSGCRLAGNAGARGDGSGGRGAATFAALAAAVALVAAATRRRPPRAARIPRTGG
jgi:hypothetical protein